MKILLLSCILLAGLFCFAVPSLAPPLTLNQSGRTPFAQVDVLRVAPDEAAEFVPMALPAGWGNNPVVEVLSQQGEWEEVRLYYRFKYNGSTNPEVCKMSLFEGSFTGFRKISETE